MRHILFIFIVFTAFSCEEQYDLDTSEFTPSIVVNSIFTNESSWQVELKTSRNALDPNSVSEFVDDAEVKILLGSGQSVCNLDYLGNGLYGNSKCFPEEEQTYLLTVFSPKYGLIRAESSIPRKANVQSLKACEKDGQTTISFEVEDPSKSYNYYIWNLVDRYLTVGQQNEPEEQEVDPTRWVTNLKDQIHKIKTNRYSGKFSASEGELSRAGYQTEFNTKNSIKKLPDSEDSTGVDGGASTVDTLKPELVTMLQMMTASEELYNYFQSIEGYVKYEAINSSAIEPTTAYSNIKGGHGIFAGYAVEYIPIR